MSSYDIIAALTDLANASTPGDSFLALDRARSVLGREVETYHPLLESLTKRAEEIDQLRTLARYDALTGIYNRRTFEEAFQREFARVRRTGESFAVVLLDLDGLKEINDNAGHAAGDQALKTVARECSRNIRSTDIAARLGGDEFGIILAGSDLSCARAFVQRLRNAIESHRVADRQLGVSFGVAAANASVVRPEDITGEADADLYRDKGNRASGRDRRSELATSTKSP
jgi:diguanylate cyclase (GGDEF)-like protein